jgi:DNA-binding transcriptional LysR family regulator
MNQIEQMQTFVRVVEAGSITKAAEQMHIAKSAISRKLHELETRLGASLLSRTTRSQALTDIGRQYYHDCLRILNDIYETEGQISNTQTRLVGKIKMSVPLSYGLNVLSPLLTEFKARHPNIEFDIDLSDRRVDLIEEGFDLAIRIADLKDSNLIANKLTDVQLLLCASPNYLEQHGRPSHPNDLLSHQRLNYSDQAEGWLFEDATGRSISVKVPYSITANNGDFLVQAACNHLGFTLVPDFIAQPFIQQGKLESVLEDYLHNANLGAFAVYPYTRHLSHRVRVLIEFLKTKLTTKI